MKLLSFILAFAFAQGVLSACVADNCARAVTGTVTGKMPPVSSRRADCSSFMLVTVTPATKTTTATATVTTTTSVAGMKRRQVAALKQRQVTMVPSRVPVYASACSGTARYSSACSCWGITAMTTTAPTPSATTTVTTTVTATVIPCAADGDPCDLANPGACCSETCCETFPGAAVCCF